MDNLEGTVFRKSGGRGGKGYWIVIAMTPLGGCACIGVDEEFRITSACHYQPHYVRNKREKWRINVEDIRFVEEKKCDH